MQSGDFIMSSYYREDFIASKIENLKDNTITYKAYQIRENQNIFLWTQQKPRSLYKVYENSYKLQKKKKVTQE